MIGKKVKVFWPVDESWYTGIVEEYDPHTGEHCLQYADGDTEWVKIGDLSSQQQHHHHHQHSPSTTTKPSRDKSMEHSIAAPLHHRTADTTVDGNNPSSVVSKQLPPHRNDTQNHEDDEDDDHANAAGNGTSLLLPPPKLSSSKSASPYPYIPTPPPTSSSSPMMYANSTGNPAMILPSAQFGANPAAGGPPHFMPYQPHYSSSTGAVGGPPPPHMMMMPGGHVPPPTPHYAMMPPHMYDPSSMNGGGGGNGAMDMMPPGPMMVMGGPGGEMMLLDYPPMMGPPGSNTNIDHHNPHHAQHHHHHHQMMMKNMNSVNSNDAGGGSNNRSRKSGPKPWTKEEDNLLLTLVQTMQWPMKWTVVAQTLQDRTGKQCRERYVNHLNPRLKSSDWAPVEDATIFHLYNTIGSHWAKMSKIIPGRTDNGIKNRFHNIRRQYEREDTHRMRLSNMNEYKEEVRHDRLRTFPEHMSGKTLALWDMKCGIGIMAAQSILNGSSSCNTISGLTASFNRGLHNNNNNSSSGGSSITNNSTINNNNSTINNSTNNNNDTSGSSGNVSGTTPPSSTTGSQNNRFGPFREVVVTTTTYHGEGKDDDDNDEIKICLDGSEICVRCGLIVPSIHTGNEICTKTGWCISCVFVPPNICSNLLRETLNLRRCVDTGSIVRGSSKMKTTTDASTSSTKDTTMSKEEVNELRSIIESFEEFFHPASEGEAWQYQSNASASKGSINDSRELAATLLTANTMAADPDNVDYA